MKKLLFWGTAISGITAAYLMYRRGESLPNIARKVGIHPISSLISELRQTS